MPFRRATRSAPPSVLLTGERLVWSRWGQGPRRVATEPGAGFPQVEKRAPFLHHRTGSHAAAVLALPAPMSGDHPSSGSRGTVAGRAYRVLTF